MKGIKTIFLIMVLMDMNAILNTNPHYSSTLLLLRKKNILQFWIMKYSLVSNHISHYLVCLSSPIRIIHKKQNLLHNLPFFPLFI